MVQNVSVYGCVFQKFTPNFEHRIVSLFWMHLHLCDSRDVRGKCPQGTFAFFLDFWYPQPVSLDFRKLYKIEVTYCQTSPYGSFRWMLSSIYQIIQQQQLNKWKTEHHDW